MSEKILVIDHLKFSYEGLFNSGELYNIVAGFFFEKGYDWLEKLNEEQVMPEGKQVRLILEPWKNISDYYRITVRIKMNYTDLKEVEVEHEGQQLKLQHGLVRITFDAYVITDRKNQMTDKPFFWFLSVMANRYFFKDHFEKAETWIKSDIDDLHGKIKTYLNTFKYTYHA